MYLQFLFTFILIVGAIDIYFYRHLRATIKGKFREKTVPKWLRMAYWSFSIFTLAFLFFAMYFYIAKEAPPKFARIYITGFIFIVLISKLFGVVFFLIDDIKDSFKWMIRKVMGRVPKATNGTENKISRGTFIKQSGLIATAIPFTTMMYGVVQSAFDYNVIRVKLKSPNLPSAFNGFKILHVSDIHTGSFISKGPLRDAVKIINEQEADIVFFTGDLVNEMAEEALPFVDEFKQIYAKQGVYSILGNHDYGDYFYQKDDMEGKAHNKALITDIHHQMNWDILLNDHRLIEKEGQKIGLIGVENWGSSGRFQKYGDVAKARNAMEECDFNILLSHDPSHWGAVVRKEQRDIDLTLSGHTHGFQMGIEIPGYIKWSPSQYLYEEWAGLYQKNAQWIYVNRGLGFLGYPGRLGILPEITVIELERNIV
ncbi:MAG: metallophosphoesterase [Vicingaceae bacterium]